MTKKYFSENEFSFINPVTKLEEAYAGYVEIRDNKAYKYNSTDELISGTSFVTKINLSNKFFDRILDEELSLPRTLEECTFQANDFIKANVINKIIDNIDENNSYLFSNSIISQNDIPLNDEISVITPYRPFINEEKTEYGNVSDWIFSNISYNTIQNIRNKTNWPTDIVGYDFMTDDIIDCLIIPTNKRVDDTSENKLFAVFLIFKNKIKLINVYLPEFSLETESDPLLSLNEQTLITNEVNKRKFIQYSPSNNDKNNLDLVNFSNIEPGNDKSITFKNITGACIDENYLFVIDKDLNGIFKYDISKCIDDRGAASNKIILADYIQNNNQLVNDKNIVKPSSISSFDKSIAVFDDDSLSVKIIDKYFNTKTIITSGPYSRQTPKFVKICPYDFTINDVLIDKGSIWIVSEVAKSISIDIFDNTGEYVTSKVIESIELIENIWTDPETSLPSSEDPAKNIETVKKIEFSYNNSNYYYIITDRRVIKLHLSKMTKPIGIMSYYNRSITINDMKWSNVYQPWQSVQDLSGNLVPWNYDRDAEIVKFPAIKCFALTGVENIDADIIFNIIDNREIFNIGKVQRIDNPISKKLLFVNKSTKQVTYLGDNAVPLLSNIGDLVQSYENIDNVPVITENFFTVEPIISDNKVSRNTMILFKEYNIFKMALLTEKVESYHNTEMYIKNDEYFNALTFNKMLNKLIFNLEQLKNNIFGSFVAGYSYDNIMTFDHVKPISDIQNLLKDLENYYVANNEATSIILNRCLINVYNVQLNILKNIQTTYQSSLNYNFNNYKII